MSNPHLIELQHWLTTAKRGFGWDMITAYDRRTLNRLLQQHYIDAFSENRQLPLISRSIQNTHNIEHLSRMQLRSPQASFETSDLGSDQLRLSLDFIGGTLITELHIAGAPHVAKIRSISPVGAPRLTFGAPLTAMIGTVHDARAIVLDLAKGDDFKADFALDDTTQALIGSYFKTVFATLPNDRKTFPLGRMNEHAPIAQTLIMRIMAAPGAADEASANHGDGAVLYFARFFSQYDGNLPGEGSDFLYPIAAATASIPFSMTYMEFNNSARLEALIEDRGTWPILLDEVFLGDHVDFYAHAIGLSVEHKQGAFYGCVEPKAATFALEPVMPLVLAGGRQQFTPQGAVSGLKWSVRATDPEGGNVGSISSTGLYTAPPASALRHASETVLVTAEGRVEGKDRRASALVSVLREGVSTSPAFVMCDAGRHQLLSAETSPGSALPRWALRDPGLGGKLWVSSGRTCTYTASSTDNSDGAPYLDIIEVSNPDSGEVVLIHVLVMPFPISMPLRIGPSSRLQNNEVDLQVLVDNIPKDLKELMAIARVEVHGYTGGGISNDGVYRAPAHASGIAIIVLTVADFFSDWHGVLALPMPLQAHAEVLEAISASMYRHLPGKVSHP